MREKRLFSKRKPTVGSVPGTLNIDEDSPSPKIKIISFNESDFSENEIDDPSELVDKISRPGEVHWVDVQGLGEEKTIRKLGEIFKLHPLVLEDITHVPQLPKIEEYENGLFICLRMLSLKEGKINSEQVSAFLSENFVVTFQERYGDVLDPVRDSIRRKAGIRKKGEDYTAYAIMDTIVDNYFPVLNNIGDALEELEDEMILSASKHQLSQLYSLKHELMGLKRILWPTKDAISRVTKGENKYIDSKTALFLRDVHDHIMQLIDMLDFYRELASELTNVYLSFMNNKMNEIIKVLTIISTIFIPLSFVASLYGMNFYYMPELAVKWAYPVVLAAMGAIAVGMLYYFKRKGWFKKQS